MLPIMSDIFGKKKHTPFYRHTEKITFTLLLCVPTHKRT